MNRALGIFWECGLPIVELESSPEYGLFLTEDRTWLYTRPYRSGLGRPRFIHTNSYIFWQDIPKAFEDAPKEEGTLLVSVRHTIEWQGVGEACLGALWLPTLLPDTVPLQPGDTYGELVRRACMLEETDAFDHPVFERDQAFYRHKRKQLVADRKEQEKKRTVTDRAFKLLVSCLNYEQRTTLETLDYFKVLGQDGQTYVVYAKSGHVNVYLEIDDVFKAAYCHGPVDADLPIYDRALAHKLILETDITRFFAEANETVITPEFLEQHRIERERRATESRERFIQALQETMSRIVP